MRILFMATPEFAIPCLEALIDNFDVIGVVTQPDKPKGRGYELAPSPVKVCAAEHNIPVYQPATFKNGAFENELSAIDPDIIVVVAYGKILPAYVLNYPKFGCVNVHGSLLPKYRGAAPMQRAIIEGEKLTGVTTMYMAEGLDTGDMLEKSEIVITEDDNFESVHDKLSSAGAKLIVSTLHKLEKGEIVPEKQDDSLSTYAAKIEKSDCIIDFSDSADRIHDLIRGLSPFPLAYSYLNGKMVKFVASCVISRDKHDVIPGTVLSLSSGIIEIACHEGSVGITRLLPEGRSRMSASDFINGRKINVGDVFSIPEGKDSI